MSIVREAIAVLMDEELAPELSERMHLLANGVPGVLGTSDLRTRISGTHWFVQLHVELPGDLSLQQSHSLCKQVEDAIRSEFPAPRCWPTPPRRQPRPEHHGHEGRFALMLHPGLKREPAP